jgi:predicted RNA-binding Zn ribbon-like protein
VKPILVGMLAVAASTFALPLAALSDEKPSRLERMQHWAADREIMMHARLAGMKAGLGLAADQEKLWNPFEAAIMDVFKSRMDTMEEMMRMRESGKRMSPVDRMEFMADHMARHATRLKAVSEAAKPLYSSLDATQKSTFEVLAQGMMMSARMGPEGVELGGDVGFQWEPAGWGWGEMP